MPGNADTCCIMISPRFPLGDQSQPYSTISLLAQVHGQSLMLAVDTCMKLYRDQGLQTIIFILLPGYLLLFSVVLPDLGSAYELQNLGAFRRTRRASPTSAWLKQL